VLLFPRKSKQKSSRNFNARDEIHSLLPVVAPGAPQKSRHSSPPKCAAGWAFPMLNPPKFRGRHTDNCGIYKLWNCGIEKKKQNTYDRTVRTPCPPQAGVPT
jgi:hypothetical protein